MVDTDPERFANRSVRSMSSSDTEKVPGPPPNPPSGRSLLDSGLLPSDSISTRFSVVTASSCACSVKRSWPSPGVIVTSQSGVFSTEMVTGKLLSEAKASPPLDRKLNVMLLSPAPDV